MRCALQSYDDLFIAIHLACGLLSALGSLFIIFFCIWLRTLEVYSYKLIFFFSIGQFILSLEFLFPPSIQTANQNICSFFGFLINSGQMISVLWMTCIASTILKVFLGSLQSFNKIGLFWVVSSWILIPLLNCIPIITGNYTAIGTSCTYDRKTNGTIERVFIFFLPVWIMLSFSIVCYCKVFYMMKNIEINPNLKKMIQRLMYYPIVMAVNIILLTVERIFLYTTKGCELSEITLASSTMTSLNGFINFLLFVCTPGNLELVKMRMNQKKEKSISMLSELTSSLYVISEDNTLP
jgi:hypothetical protein